LRYPKGTALDNATGGTITNPAPGAYTIHTFTGPGTFAVNAAVSAAYSVN
jgi:hypothetical protein